MRDIGLGAVEEKFPDRLPPEKTCYNKSKYLDCFECSECGFYTEDAAGLMIGELFKRCPICEAKVMSE